MRRIGDAPATRAILITLATLLTTLFLVVPLASIFYQAFAEGLAPFWHNLSDQYTRQAIMLTLLIALVTVPVNLVFGVFLAWLVTRFSFPGRRLLQTFIDIPFAVSPVVAGLLYLLLYGRTGWLGSLLSEADVQLMFAWPGMVLVTIFVTCPFVARELIPLMQAQGSADEEAAVTLGAGGWTLFRRVTLPKIRWALVYGVILTNARAIGEYGAVAMVSGTIRGETVTLPLQVELLYQDYNTVGAFTSAALLAAIAVVTLVVKGVLEWHTQRRGKRHA
ncbi:sulfate ABC transporter permease subunit CysW [Kushneria aurantia]|uniref:Sulfate ABC transporter permease subunit CysW n=1 Tax=Kushneria aurantia TaxID=504092 RepID=A0ABV6G3J4_9GAMM|nr:sulfate ABC transporter permease subunit CysW [Kushneria aurantia]